MFSSSFSHSASASASASANWQSFLADLSQYSFSSSSFVKVKQQNQKRYFQQQQQQQQQYSKSHLFFQRSPFQFSIQPSIFEQYQKQKDSIYPFFSTSSFSYGSNNINLQRYSFLPHEKQQHSPSSSSFHPHLQKKKKEKENHHGDQEELWKVKDELFWMFFYFVYGIKKYEKKMSFFSIFLEKKTKMQMMEVYSDIFSSKHHPQHLSFKQKLILIKKKLFLSIQQIEENLTSRDKISIPCFLALCFLHDVNIVWHIADHFFFSLFFCQSSTTTTNISHNLQKKKKKKNDSDDDDDDAEEKDNEDNDNEDNNEEEEEEDDDDDMDENEKRWTEYINQQVFVLTIHPIPKEERKNQYFYFHTNLSYAPEFTFTLTRKTIHVKSPIFLDNIQTGLKSHSHYSLHELNSLIPSIQQSQFFSSFIQSQKDKHKNETVSAESLQLSLLFSPSSSSSSSSISLTKTQKHEVMMYFFMFLFHYFE